MNRKKFWKTLFGFQIGDRVRLREDISWSSIYRRIAKGTIGTVRGNSHTLVDGEMKLIIEVEFPLNQAKLGITLSANLFMDDVDPV